jgi:succinate dehydrogenase/fumarate reductase flavoprotein subunit
MDSFDEEFDVVVCGSGNSGLVSAIELADAGARVLIIEKSSVPGGISICSGGGLLSADDAEDAFTYLKEICGGRTSDELLRVLAGGMTEIQPYLTRLAKMNGAEVVGRGGAGFESITNISKGKPPAEFTGGATYPLPGYKTFYYTTVKDIPGFIPENDFPAQSSTSQSNTRTFGGGIRIYKVLYDNVMSRDNITLRFSSAAQRLIKDHESGAIIGLEVHGANGQSTTIKARAVVLACGGFEGSQDLKAQFWEGTPVDGCMAKHNTGDGIRMAQEVGAALWHMWHFHGSYAFRHPSPDYPYLIRTRRFPNWRPGEQDSLDVKMPWIIIDQLGKRYMNEYDPYLQDTNHRTMHRFDPTLMRFTRNPSLLIFDDDGRNMYALGQPTYNDPDILHYRWSDDNRKEIELGIITEASTLEELAGQIGIDAAILKSTVDAWNADCEQGSDREFGRPSGSMMPILKPPFHAANIHPCVSNTQGGIVHNIHYEAVSPFGAAIEGLYVAGEISSVFGHLYSAGGNLAETFVSSRVAADHIRSKYLTHWMAGHQQVHAANS